jgi:hypothetical protein
LHTALWWRNLNEWTNVCVCVSRRCQFLRLYSDAMNEYGALVESYGQGKAEEKCSDKTLF